MPLVGNKPPFSSPSVTYRKVTAKIWVSPNLIRALSESTRAGVGRRGVRGTEEGWATFQPHNIWQ